MKNKILSVIGVAVIYMPLTYALSVNNAVEYYLAKPTGIYHVGYKDYHWINEQSCPDPFYIKAPNDKDYSDGNVNHCREITARIYYPTDSTEVKGNNYFRPYVQAQQKSIKSIPGVTEQELLELNDIMTYSSENQPIITNKQFPVILFSPGFTDSVQAYENVITDVVSHGYIVVGFNSSYMNLTQLPNGHVIEPLTTYDINIIEKEYLPIGKQDLNFVYDRVVKQPHSDAIFKAMDTRKIGAFGHSLGARLIADVSHEHPGLFAAAAALDVALDTTGNSQKRFSIPFMQAICANRISADPYGVHFELGGDGYLVGMSPSEENHKYSQHMNFGDLSTLQYMSAYKKAIPYWKRFAPYFVGDGDGYEINHSVNSYIVTFFNMYLKGEVSGSLKSCKVLSENSYMKCG